MARWLRFGLRVRVRVRVRVRGLGLHVGSGLYLSSAGRGEIDSAIATLDNKACEAVYASAYA